MKVNGISYCFYSLKAITKCFRHFSSKGKEVTLLHEIYIIQYHFNNTGTKSIECLSASKIFRHGMTTPRQTFLAPFPYIRGDRYIRSLDQRFSAFIDLSTL